MGIRYRLETKIHVISDMKQATIFHYTLISIRFITLLHHTHCYRFEPNILTLNNYSSCSEDKSNPIHLNMSVEPISRNKYRINGEAIFEENLRTIRGIDLLNTQCSNQLVVSINQTYYKNFKSFSATIDLEEM